MSETWKDLGYEFRIVTKDGIPRLFEIGSDNEIELSQPWNATLDRLFHQDKVIEKAKAKYERKIAKATAEKQKCIEIMTKYNQSAMEEIKYNFPENNFFDGWITKSIKEK